ncbi:MAG: EAL domain-containing protein [Ruminococcus sp.]|nr:EAL domain-containing protein [Ruminococcus sp.]
MDHKDEIFSKIAEALLIDYTSVYYVNAVTNEYQWYSGDAEFHSLQIQQSGKNFFENLVRDADQVVYEEDKHIFMEDMKKDNLISAMKKGTMQSVTYRLMIDGKPVYHRLRLIRGLDDDSDYFILGVINVDKEMRMQQEAEKLEQERVVYDQISESLALHYDLIYYVDSRDSTYNEFTFNSIYGSLRLKEDGLDFFGDVIRNGNQLLHPEDKERVVATLSRDSLITALDTRKQVVTDYRLLIKGIVHYTRMTAMWASDKVHLIIGVENTDEEVKREHAQGLALSHANELARRDELTGVKNRNAYHELAESVQKNMDNGASYMPFALVLCDINGLKLTNDTLGHSAGDELIRSACRLICNVFTHSPIFRIGGDEFVAYLGSDDYHNKDALFERLRDQVHENLNRKEGPVVASGIAVYEPQSDTKFADVFSRADGMMYEDKNRLKSGYYLRGKDKEMIPEEDKRKLEALFNALEIVSEGAYVYLCDMRYNYSRWSKAAVDSFGLPSEYMYEAGDIWEEHIHPDDRNAYHTGITDIFAGNASGHDMQYRAMKRSGEYDVCTCRGIVLRDDNGKPEYFGGVIRNHAVQGHIDTLTGLRNQYGFFEDLQSNMIKHTKVNVAMIVINKFSEINEVYGYQFGNSVLQKFGRYLFEHVGNNGNAYRLDGTKFAVLSKTHSAEDMHDRYDDLRSHFRKGFTIDDRQIILDLSAGMMCVDNYEIDHQTVYACLNFAYSESKLRRQGDLVEFYNDLNENNRHRLEKLYEIRVSIMQNYRGFYLLYQPVVDAETEQLIGAEALLRWRSDEFGMVPPDQFIPILEKDPLFCELGQWILRTAINGAKLIMEEHPDFVINVNLSYTQLEKLDFVEMVLRTLREEGFPPDHLCMEITERCRLLDMYLLKNVIVNLRGQGIQIALDDFGTGFSSVGLVKNLPFDTIKIDRSFVNKIEEDEKERELVKSFAGIATTFGAKVCVEGIETEEMRDILQQYNIQSFQGYYYGKPLELRDFLVWKPHKPQK